MEKQTGSKLGKEHIKTVYCLIPCLFNLPASWEICMQVTKQQLELDMKQ